MINSLKITLVGLASLLACGSLIGCGNVVNRLDRGLFKNSAADYHIFKNTGNTAAPLEDYWVHNIKVTQESGTDGLFFILDGNVIEIQGAVTSVRLENGFTGPNKLPAHLLTP